MENKQVAKLTPIQTVLRKAEKKFQNISNDLEFNKEAFYASQTIKDSKMLTSFVKSKPESIVSSLVTIATLNLTLNPVLAYCYLVPRDGKASLDISYRGMIKILTDSGTVRNIDADDVYTNDEFICEKGTSPFLKHIPNIRDRGEYVGTYAVAFFHDGGNQFLFMSDAEIRAVEKVSKAASSEYSPWQTFRTEMQKKTVIRRLYKILPKTKISDNVIGALEHDDKQNPVEFVKVDKNADLFDEAEIVPDEPIAKIDEPELPTDE